MKVNEIIKYLSQVDQGMDVKIDSAVGRHESVKDIQTWVSGYPNDSTKENETYILLDI